MIAKADPSKSAVCGPNQLILVGAPYFYVENEFGTNFLRILVSCCLQESCFLQATADHAADKFWCQIEFYHKNMVP